MRTLKVILAATAVSTACFVGNVWAANDSPVGVWKTIDDSTGKAKSLVQITDEGGTLHGKVIKILHPSHPNPTCDKCDGDKKGKPIEGMEIMWGVKKDGSQWDGGKILDPEKGKTYGVKLSLEDGGDKLDVRGFIGFSLLGRTQTWVRETDPAATSDSTTSP
ncbi:DUF2147 domain-containing protein [Solimonas marina]|uniref:DUF2147 domain-containing protein n=1 Tax=Solimonas marina TaxID=2714601 RepID=A0A969W7Q6_9GAMM|nr:DUF2147 domain-containing protein [Solimonas marina]NKF21034.1 DUF2147 domain-containing protein [Solimonas marina]